MRMDKIIHGDSLHELKRLADNSVDLICTDPPYGYNFMGKDWDKAVPSVEIWKECLRVLKPGGFAFVMSAPRQDVLSQMIVRIGDAGFETNFTSIYWTYASGFPKSANIGKMVDKRKGVVREIIGSMKNTSLKGNSYGTKQEQKASVVFTKGTGPLEGSYGGFQPKPAVEVIIVAMKPLSEKTFVGQALKNGKGITWLDECRIPAALNDRQEYGRDNLLDYKSGSNSLGKFNKTPPYVRPTTGRFPANLLVSDDVLNDGKITKSAVTIQPELVSKNAAGFQPNPRAIPGVNQHGDSGSYSRYFDLDAWANTLPFLIVAKASKLEKGAGCTHPTVKPLKLMSYLITLGSREADVVLDPFAGSGTTCVAAKHLERHFIGIEREAEYVKIAKARIAAVPPQQMKLIAAE